MVTLKGIAASPGIAIGPAWMIETQALEVKRRKVDNTQAEVKRFLKAVNHIKQQLEGIIKTSRAKKSEEEAEIFKAHLLILEDPELILSIKNTIVNEKTNAEASIMAAVEHFKDIFMSIEDNYIKSRIADIEDVAVRLVKILENNGDNFMSLKDEIVLVANDLAPSDISGLDREKILGFATVQGSRTSHLAIIARSVKIPAVVGVENLLKQVITQNSMVIVDGTEGLIYLNPDSDLLNSYREKQQLQKLEEKHLLVYKNKEARTACGTKIKVCGNIGNEREVPLVLEHGGEGIGLFRTEFLYLDRSKPPTEEEQYRSYSLAACSMEHKTVIIRTLDAGGDKNIPYLHLPQEDNPFLGYRALRICLDNPEIFLPQLKAILRASIHGNIKIMYPMINGIEELRAANCFLQNAMEELTREGCGFNADIETGIMIETPSAVMMAEALAREADFFSIGTNDLVQYTLAADRTNPKISYLYNHYHPAVLRLIKKTVEAGHAQGVKVCMCGEAACDELLLPFLIGIGIDELSMSAASILKIKKLIGQYTVEKAHQLSDKVVTKDSIAEVINLLKAFISD